MLAANEFFYWYLGYPLECISSECVLPSKILKLISYSLSQSSLHLQTLLHDCAALTHLHHPEIYFLGFHLHLVKLCFTNDASRKCVKSNINPPFGSIIYLLISGTKGFVLALSFFTNCVLLSFARTVAFGVIFSKVKTLVKNLCHFLFTESELLLWLKRSTLYRSVLGTKFQTSSLVGPLLNAANVANASVA